MSFTHAAGTDISVIHSNHTFRWDPGAPIERLLRKHAGGAGEAAAGAQHLRRRRLAPHAAVAAAAQAAPPACVFATHAPHHPEIQPLLKSIRKPTSTGNVLML